MNLSELFKISLALTFSFLTAFPTMVIAADDVIVDGGLNITGTVKATQFSGDGSALTGVTVANGVIGDAQIVGIISATKLDLSTVQPKYSKVAIVAKSGGDYDNPANAMLDSATWCGTPSNTNPCLLKVMPGVYTISTPVTMKQYIDIEGSGEKTTKVTSGLISGTTDPLFTATLKGTGNAELRHITIENTGDSSYCAAILNNAAPLSMVNVTINVATTCQTSYGIYNYSYSSGTITNLTLNVGGGTAINYGIYNSYSSPVITNATLSITGYGSENYGIYNFISGPKITNVTIRPSGATTAYGVYNANSSSPLVANTQIYIFGGTYAYGIYNTSIAQPTITNATISISGPTQNAYGLYSNNSPTVLINSTITASGTNSYGVYNAPAAGGGGAVNIDHSVIKGYSATIYNSSGAITRIGNTRLDGAAVINSGGTLTCAGVYDEAYIFYPNTCP